MTSRRWVIKSVVGLTCLGAAACQQGTGGTTPNAATSEAAKAPIDIGTPLMKGEPAEKVETAAAADETVIVPGAVVRLDKKQQVAAEVDAKIEVIGTAVSKGRIVPAGERGFANNPVDIEQQVATADVPVFRRLREGDRVRAGDYVFVLNDLDARVQEQAAIKVKNASANAIKAAKTATEAMQALLDSYKNIPAGAVSKSDILQYEAQVARYFENEMQSEKERAKSEGDEVRARALRSRHYAKSKVNGVIAKIMREEGEFAKAGDPVMEIVSTDEVTAEGNLEASYADKVQINQKVTLELNLPIGPDLKVGSVYHQLEVTGVAVTSGPRPLVVSVSADGTAVVWEALPADGKPRTPARLAHGVGVRSVAATGAKVAKPMVVTGGDDGRVRVWDVSNPDKVAATPIKVFEEAHPSGVTAIAFSPDGKYLATAAGRDVWVWDAMAGKKLYALAGEHKDAVTSVRFTPQGTLVTAARDRALRVWKLGDKAAAVERSVDHRKANVDTLGVSSGGGRALFDQEDGRIDVVSLATGLPVGRIQNASAASRFATLALFSADDKFVLTAGGDADSRGELQLWDTPQAGGRAAERRRLITPERADPTSAAFATANGQPFVVVGTKRGGVHVWTYATLSEASSVRKGRVTSVFRSDAKTVKVRVETERDNADAAKRADDLMQDKGTATIIIHPGQMAPTPGSAAAPSGGILPAGGVAPVGEAIVPAAPVLPAPGGTASSK